MTDLMLHPSEQAALRAVIASEPDRGTDLPGESVLHDVARLIPCDAVGIALLDAPARRWNPWAPARSVGARPALARQPSGRDST